MFKQTLESILDRTDGSVGALIMGTDGIAVERVMTPDAVEANLDVAVAEFTSLVRSAQRTGSEIGLGELQELVIKLSGSVVVMRLLNSEYFLVLALAPEGNVGRGRFECRKAEFQLASEFAV